jgi:FMN-dependent NADH-azoreductase
MMNVDEIVQLADHLMWSQRKKHLSDLQKVIIRGVCQGKEYEEIGKKIGKSEDHIRNTASKLWQIISEILGEKVNRFNVKTALERQVNILSQNFNNNYITHNNLNICHPPQITQPNHNNSTSKPQQDLTQSPNIKHFYGRNKEIEILENIISNNRLITVFGLTGIGKSTLVKRYIDLHINDFNSIIWLNLQLKPTLDTILNKLLEFLDAEVILPDTIDSKIAKLLALIAEKRCLIIFDNFHCLYQKGELSGQYLKSYESYGNFLKLIAESSHQSCLIVISQEKPKEIICLESRDLPVAVIPLQGLGEDAKFMLDDLGLPDQDSWLSLIELYQGNPLFLSYLTRMIQELGITELTDIIADDSLMITEELEDCFREIWSRLSETEQNVLIALSNSQQPVTIQELKELVTLSQNGLVNAVRSLLRRCLIQTEEASSTFEIFLSKLLKNIILIYKE